MQNSSLEMHSHIRPHASPVDLDTTKPSQTYAEDTLHGKLQTSTRKEDIGKERKQTQRAKERAPQEVEVIEENNSRTF